MPYSLSNPRDTAAGIGADREIRDDIQDGGQKWGEWFAVLVFCVLIQPVNMFIFIIYVKTFYR